MANGTNGRDDRGKFGPGNQAARGRSNPHAARVAELRAAFVSSVTEEDVREVLAALIHEARSGNVPAMREFFNRILGQAEAADVLARMGEIEALLERTLAKVTP
jgi:hypothetical protein